MQLLDSSHLQRLYAVEAFDIYLRWQRTSEQERKAKIEAVLRQIAALSRLPMPKVVWTIDGSSYFRHAPWEIHASQRAVTNNPNSDLKHWVHAIASPYHELRHADQHRMMILAHLARALPVPDIGSRRGRAYHVKTAEVDIVELLMGIYEKLDVLLALTDQKLEFRQSWIPQVRAWSDSIFGTASNRRKQIFTVMHKVDVLNAEQTAAYRGLPEEVDAFQTQSAVKAHIKAMIARHTDYSGIAELFAGN